MFADDVVITDHTKEKTSGYLLDVKPDPEKSAVKRLRENVQPCNSAATQESDSDNESTDSYIQDPNKYSLQKLDFKDKLSQHICGFNSDNLEAVSVRERKILTIPIPTPRLTFDLSYEPITADDTDFSVTMTPEFLRPSVNLLVNLGKRLISEQYSRFYDNETVFIPLTGIQDNPQKGIIKFPDPSSSSINPNRDSSFYTRHLNWRLKDEKNVVSQETITHLNSCIKNKCVFHYTSSLLLARHMQICHLRALKIDSQNKGRYLRKINSMAKNHKMLPLYYPTKSCPLCNETFSARNRISYHFEFKHFLPFIGEDQTKPDLCSHCGNYRTKNSTSIPCHPRTSIQIPSDYVYEAGLTADPSRGLDGHSLASFILIPNPGAYFDFSSKEIKYHVEKFVYQNVKAYFDSESFSIAQRYSIAISSLYGKLVSDQSRFLAQEKDFLPVTWKANGPKPIHTLIKNNLSNKENECKPNKISHKRSFMGRESSKTEEITPDLECPAKKQRSEQLILLQTRTIENLLSFSPIEERPECKFCVDGEHLILDLADNEELSCPICHLKSECISRLIIHLFIVHSTYYKMEALKNSIIKIDPEKYDSKVDRINDFICELCEFHFDDDTEYLDHLAKAHPQEKDNMIILVCSHCQMTCRTKTGYRDHIGVKCFICHEEIPCQTKLLAHIYFSHCKVVLLSEVRRSLKASTSNHQCKTCGMKFFRQELLKRHMELVHNKMKCCPKCKALFSDDRAYSAHIHVDCPACNAYVSCLSEVRRHVEKKHIVVFTLDEMSAIAVARVPDKAIPPNSDISSITTYYKRLLNLRAVKKNGLFECRSCRRVMKSWKTFDEHVIRLHSKVGKKVTLPCSICKLPTDDTIDLLIHMMAKHGVSTLLRILEDNEAPVAKSKPVQDTTDMLALRAIGNTRRYTNNTSGTSNSSDVTNNTIVVSQASNNKTQPTTKMSVLSPKVPIQIPVPSGVSLIQNRVNSRPMAPTNHLQQYIIANSNFQMPRFIVSKSVPASAGSSSTTTTTTTTNQIIPQIIANQSNKISTRPMQASTVNLISPTTSTNQQSINNNTTRLIPSLPVISQQPGLTTTNSINIVPLTITSLNNNTNNSNSSSVRSHVIRPINLAHSFANTTTNGTNPPNFVIQLPQTSQQQPTTVQMTIKNRMPINTTTTSQSKIIPPTVVQRSEPIPPTSSSKPQAMMEVSGDGDDQPEITMISSKGSVIQSLEKNVACEACNLKFHHQKTFEEHQKWIHLLPDKDKTKDFTQPRTMVEEFPHIPSPIIYYCTDCRIELSTLEKFIIHKRFRCKFRSLIVQQTCELCGLVVTSKMSMMHHMLKKHPKEIGDSCQPIKSWRCNECINDFFFEMSLENHLHIICPYCLYWFPCFTFLYIHVFLMHSTKIDVKVLYRLVKKVFEFDVCLYKCLNCDIDIGTISLLDSHLLRQHHFDQLSSSLQPNTKAQVIKRGIRCSKCDQFLATCREYIYHSFYVHNLRADVVRKYNIIPQIETTTALNEPNIDINDKENQNTISQINEKDEMPTTSTMSSNSLSSLSFEQNTMNTNKSKRKSQPKKIITDDTCNAVQQTFAEQVQNIPDKTLEPNTQIEFLPINPKVIDPEPGKSQKITEDKDDNLSKDEHVTCPLCEFSSTSRDEIMDHLASQHC